MTMSGWVCATCGTGLSENVEAMKSTVPQQMRGEVIPKPEQPEDLPSRPSRRVSFTNSFTNGYVGPGCESAIQRLLSSGIQHRDVLHAGYVAHQRFEFYRANTPSTSPTLAGNCPVSKQ